ncbi:MAG: glutamate dehydrogenase, partial [Bacteroidota bacterium]
PEATGYGTVYFAKEMLATRNQTFKGKIVAVSGSGNVSQYAIEKVNELGEKVVTASDSSGFIYDPNGIDNKKLAYLMELKNIKRGRIKEYADKYGVQYFENERPWGIKVDVALPCATQNEVNEEEAQLLIKNGCYCISEGANMPSTPEAIKIYIDNKILYGPGKAANAGGVSVSGLEMSQNSMRYSWTREEVDTKLHSIMVNIHENCVKWGKEGDFINYVNGANIAGFVKVADAMLAQGLV